MLSNSLLLHKARKYPLSRREPLIIAYIASFVDFAPNISKPSEATVSSNVSTPQATHEAEPTIKLTSSDPSI